MNGYFTSCLHLLICLNFLVVIHFFINFLYNYLKKGVEMLHLRL